MGELGWELVALFGLLLLLLAFVRCQRGCWLRDQNDSEEGADDEY